MVFNPDGIPHPDRYSYGIWLWALKYTPYAHIFSFIFGVMLADLNGMIAHDSRLRIWLGVGGSDLKYSDIERKAVMRGGLLGTVVAETATAASVSNEVEVTLLPAAKVAGKDGGQGQVDRMTASGRVVLTSGGRHGAGEQLVYTGATGEYILTGTAASPPRMTDSARGTVSGEALIFHGRDDSVSIEGGGRKTTAQTMAPK
jgi:lipopolysaccharide export system protein LptA